MCNNMAGFYFNKGIIMIGYKATDKNMQCRGFQFKIGKWYEHEGEVVECSSGFHFCEQPSGVWSYYYKEGTRVFEIEAEGVLDKAPEPGADVKRVCSRIKFVREIVIDGNWNTGNWNTGNRNTGDRNTGNRNTGDRNTGNSNTGDWNTGNRNTGNSNTGDRNTGDWNTGNSNTGDNNTGNSNTGNWNNGDSNTGNRNTGNRNTGNWNTGNGNATSHCTGMFCVKPQTVRCFDIDTKLTMQEFNELHPQWMDLCIDLGYDDDIDFNKYSTLPGITKKKLKTLHDKHKEARNANQNNL